MTISEVPLDVLNRFAAEKCGWLNVGARWHSPACQRDEENCGGKLPDFTEPAGMKMLLERILAVKRSAYEWDRIRIRVQWDKTELGRAALEEFCLSEGFQAESCILVTRGLRAQRLPTTSHMARIRIQRSRLERKAEGTR